MNVFIFTGYKEELSARVFTGNQLQALRTLDDKNYYYRKDGWLSGEKKALLKKLLVHINDYLKFQKLIRTNLTWSCSHIMAIKREYCYADDYLFSDWEHTRVMDCRNACKIAGIKYEYLVKWLKGISLEEIEKTLRKLNF